MGAHALLLSSQYGDPLGSVVPHANMSRACPSQAPLYQKRFEPSVAASC